MKGGSAQRMNLAVTGLVKGRFTLTGGQLYFRMLARLLI